MLNRPRHLLNLSIHPNHLEEEKINDYAPRPPARLHGYRHITEARSNDMVGGKGAPIAAKNRAWCRSVLQWRRELEFCRAKGKQASKAKQSTRGKWGDGRDSARWWWPPGPPSTLLVYASQVHTLPLPVSISLYPILPPAFFPIQSTAFLCWWS